MKSRLGISLLWVLVFLLGGVAGAVSYYLYHKHVEKPQTSQFKAREFIDDMTRVLKLDAQQREALKTIFEQTRSNFRALNQHYGPQYDVLNRQYRPRFESIRNESDDKIRGILRPDQKTRYEQMLRKVKAREKERDQERLRQNSTE